MDHRSSINKLGRNSAHRTALIKSQAKALFRYERIRTTVAKAKVARRLAEKLITRAKVDSVHNRRIAAKHIDDERVLDKLFTEIAPRYAERPGGYTRVLKMGRRFGDASEMVILELLDRKERVRQRKKKEKQEGQKEG
jgi:large subunit ribosomal protein L17